MSSSLPTSAAAAEKIAERAASLRIAAAKVAAAKIAAQAAAAHQLYGEAPPAATGVSQPRLPKTLSMKDAVSAHL